MSTILESADGRCKVETGCTISHNGRTFEAGGYVETPDHLIAYMPMGARENVGASGDVTTWDGQVIGTYRVTSRWRTPRSYMSSHMHQLLVTVGGKRYTGRSGGAGCIVRAKRCRS